MLRRLLSAIAGAWMFLSLFSSLSSAANPSTNKRSVEFGRWGTETLEAVDRDLWMADQKLYAEKTKCGERPTQLAFMWGAGVQFSALASAAKFDPSKFTAPLVAYADQLQSYWIEQHGIGGYDVLPTHSVADRYYDDNAWIALALLETYDITGKQKFRDRAADTLRFVLSGEDKSLDGGIYWRESTRDSKNTCVNAPTIVALLLLFRTTGDGHYLADAERLYKWARLKLQDDGDGLYWDNVHSSGRIDRRKFSYNSALMIRANCLLHEIKGGSQYLHEAERMAQSATARWIEPATGGVSDPACFAHMLLESLLAVVQANGDARSEGDICQTVEFIHNRLRDANGHYPGRWDYSPKMPLETIRLIDQASAARAYFATAIYLRKKDHAESRSAP